MIILRIYIEEKRDISGGVIYYKTQKDYDGKEIYSKIISIKSEKYTDEQNNTNFLLYDSDYRLISDVYRFINIEKEDQSPNTKEMYLVALKYLFAYCELFDVKPETMSEVQLKSFIKFLYGIESQGEITSMYITHRSPGTINSYMSTYRSYMEEHLGIKENIFNKKVNLNKTVLSNGLLGHLNKTPSFKYKTKQKTTKSKVVPMYINLSQYKDILECVRNEYSIREEIIIRLMFECGMRIGEVLGLTLEDIWTLFEDDSYQDLESVGKIGIINRVSDSTYQLAKGKYIPKEKGEYELGYYNVENIQYVYPAMSIIVLIQNYIDEVHSGLSPKNRTNYFATEADLIYQSKTTIENGNHYIFLNKNGKPLSQSGWNKILREIYLKVGLSLDTNKRKNNLSHRLRHGYAMFLVKYRKYTVFQLKDALRHASISTVQIYYNLTEDEIYDLNKETADALLELMPELLEIY